MSEKEFSLDDILSDLKDELKANGISDISDEEIKKYSVEMKKYDTDTLLKEVNATLTEKKHFPNYQDLKKYSKQRQNDNAIEQQKPEEQISKIQPNEDDEQEKNDFKYNKNQIKSEDNEDNQDKDNNINIQENSETNQENDEIIDDEKQNIIKEIKSMSPQELKKQEEIEEQRLRELMLSTAHIKYISLKKNREKLVKEFVLNPQYTTTQPLEIHEQSKEIIEEELHHKSKNEKDGDNILFQQDENKNNKLNQQETKEHRKEEHKFKLGEIDFDEVTSKDEAFPTENVEEYTSDSQTSNVKNYLNSMKTYLKNRLTALGVISVIAIIMSLLVDVFKVNAIGFLNKTDNPLSFVIVNLVLLVAIIGISYDTITEGIYSIFQRVVTRNTVFSIAFLSLLAVNVGMLFDAKVIAQKGVSLYVPLASVCAFGSMLGRYLDAKRRELNFNIVSNKDNRYAVTIMENQKMAEDFTKAALEDYPTLVYNKKTSFLSYFMQESFGTDESDHSAKRVLPVVCGLSVVTLLISLLLKQNVFVGFSVLNGILLVGTGVLPFLMISLPLYETAKKLSSNGGAILSVESAEDYIDVNSITLDATQIFDGQAVTLYGIKTFSDITIDKIILDATSVLCESNSILGNVFLNIINNREDYLEKCDSLLYEDGMGISAWIGNRRILIGSRELMINHNIEIPSENFEKKFMESGKSLVYLSTGGELSAVFMIGLECSSQIKQLVAGLYNNEIVSIIRTVDPILTRGTLAKVFGLPENAFRVIPSRLHKELAEISKTDRPINATVCNDGSLKGYIYSLLFAKSLPKIIQISLAINYVVMGLAVVLFVAFTLLNGVNQLNNFILCAYQIIFAVICYGLQKIFKL